VSGGNIETAKLAGSPDLAGESLLDSLQNDIEQMAKPTPPSRRRRRRAGGGDDDDNDSRSGFKKRHDTFKKRYAAVMNKGAELNRICGAEVYTVIRFPGTGRVYGYASPGAWRQEMTGAKSFLGQLLVANRRGGAVAPSTPESYSQLPWQNVPGAIGPVQTHPIYRTSDRPQIKSGDAAPYDYYWSTASASSPPAKSPKQRRKTKPAPAPEPAPVPTSGDQLLADAFEALFQGRPILDPGPYQPSSKDEWDMQMVMLDCTLQRQ
jgi:hypothetical protein